MAPSPKVKLPAKKLRSKTKTVRLSDDQKVKLANLVRKHPELWMLSHPKYKIRDTHSKVWDLIALDLQVSADECRKVWRSLKDALRYRKGSLLKPGKSGDSATEDSDQEHVETDQSQLIAWKFWDCMKFLVQQKSKRRTASSLSSVSEGTSVEQEQVSESFELSTTAEVGIDLPSDKPEPAPTRSNYDYASSVKVNKRKRSESTDGTERIASGIEELINIRKSMSGPPTEKLRYNSVYENLDRMLKQLPEPVVEDLNMQFIKLTYDALKLQQNIIFSNSQ